MIAFSKMVDGELYVSQLTKDTKVYRKRGPNLWYKYPTLSNQKWYISYESKGRKIFSPKLEKDRGFMGLTGIALV